MGEEPVFDNIKETDKEVLEGYTGPVLVVRMMCLTPRANEDKWLRNNTFQVTCTIQGKVCRFVIDAGSYKNIVSTKAVEKLGVKTESHPKPYKIAWLKKGGEVTVSKRALIFFSIALNTKIRLGVML